MNKNLKIIFHTIGILISLFLIIGIPLIINWNKIFPDSSEDVSSGASAILPDIPSGEYIILINSSLHNENLEKWEAFFSNDEENITVIFEDITVNISSNDKSAIDLGKRYQAYLPENQMTLKYINSTLLVSKVEQGHVDIAIFSKEMAQYLKFDETKLKNDVVVIKI